MDNALASYTFHSFYRKGLGNLIQELDILGDETKATEKGRPYIDMEVSVNGVSILKRFPVIGPADVIGIGADMVIRTTPARGNTNFPPNYLVHIEFYDEDLPWRYTPAQPDGDQLSPWICLLVLKEDEFERSKEVTPLPRVIVKENAPLPPRNEAWAWAHVQQTNATTLPSDSSDHIISRLLCPRRLEPNTLYCAFVVPAYESGRLAGLEKPEGRILSEKAQMPAKWGDKEGIPVYYEWCFHTGNAADFEYLAGLLEPKAADALVGRRLVDFSQPGFGVPKPNTDTWTGLTQFVEGALVSPSTSGLPTVTLPLSDFSGQIAQLINIGTENSNDPVVTVPFYGHKHALVYKLDTDTNNTSWVHQLNREPRFRAAAGIGAEIVRKFQEDYMTRAWQQLEGVAAANKTITAAVYAMNVCQQMFKKWVAPLPDNDFLMLTGPLHKKILVKDPQDSKDVTLYHAFRHSCIGHAPMNSAFRRLARRRGPWMRRIKNYFGAYPDVHDLWERIQQSRQDEAAHLLNKETKLTVVKEGFFNREPTWPLERMYEEDAHPYSSVNDGKNLYNAWKELIDTITTIPRKSSCLPYPSDRVTVSVTAVKDKVTPFTAFPNVLKKLWGKSLDGFFDQPERIVPTMAYPDFTDPMYEKLKEISLDWFIPNLHLLPQNSVTLLEANEAFIEAFFVGLNAEMGKEMLWREYPTDDRCSCFRQFWDIKGTTDSLNITSSRTQTENLKDIKRIDTWKQNEHLGTHKNGSGNNQPLVLAIRGDLLKCYPNTIVYAVKAKGVTNNPPELDWQEVKSSIFKAEVGGDISFLGFDLGKNEARTAPGWFFVFQEVPGETRFGLDLTGPPEGKTWDDIAWEHVSTDAYLNFKTAIPFKLTTSSPPEEDSKIAWGTDSAQMAYILYQKPVMMAIHANKLLEGL